MVVRNIFIISTISRSWCLLVLLLWCWWFVLVLMLLLLLPWWCCCCCCLCYYYFFVLLLRVLGAMCLVFGGVGFLLLVGCCLSLWLDVSAVCALFVCVACLTTSFTCDATLNASACSCKRPYCPPSSPPPFPSSSHSTPPFRLPIQEASSRRCQISANTAKLCKLKYLKTPGNCRPKNKKSPVGHLKTSYADKIPNPKRRLSWRKVTLMSSCFFNTFLISLVFFCVAFVFSAVKLTSKTKSATLAQETLEVPRKVSLCLLLRYSSHVHRACCVGLFRRCWWKVHLGQRWGRLRTRCYGQGRSQL